LKCYYPLKCEACWVNYEAWRFSVRVIEKEIKVDDQVWVKVYTCLSMPLTAVIRFDLCLTCLGIFCLLKFLEINHLVCWFLGAIESLNHDIMGFCSVTTRYYFSIISHLCRLDDFNQIKHFSSSECLSRVHCLVRSL